MSVPVPRPAPAGLLVALAVVSAVAGCGAGSSPGGARARVVKVVAGENPWGDIARQIGGEHASVRSLLTDPVADPHQFESDARAAAAVADARVVVVNGAGYDDFVDKLLSSTRNRGRVVVDVQDVLGANGSNVNPHFWYDLPRVPSVAAAIERALAAADPADAATFAANRKAFDASLAPARARLDEIRTKYHGVPVAYTERVAGYLLAAAGLTVATPPGFASAIEEGVEPSPGDAHAMATLLTDHEVRVLLYNSQATSPVTERVRALAQRSGVPVVAVTETLPPGQPDFQTWQRRQLDDLMRALAA